MNTVALILIASDMSDVQRGILFVIIGVISACGALVGYTINRDGFNFDRLMFCVGWVLTAVLAGLSLFSFIQGVRFLL